jgi:hypothetical protein
MHGIASGTNNRVGDGASVNPDKCTRLTASDGRVKKRVELLLTGKDLGGRENMETNGGGERLIGRGLSMGFP